MEEDRDPFTAAEEQSAPAGKDDEGAEARQLSWSERLSSDGDAKESPSASDGAGRSPSRRDEMLAAGEGVQRPPGREGLEDEIETLRQEAVRHARQDAAAETPAADSGEHPPGERTLRQRCRAVFDRWRSGQRRRLRGVLTDREETISRLLGRASLLLDRMDRMTNELIRLKARRLTRRREVRQSLGDGGGERSRGIPTKIYVGAIGFLGLVEFFANAPVFSTLLPRDPLTERQIQVMAETSQGWLAGIERVLAQLVLRPDAALLAAGVITFLCVLAHFFGHSLRELVTQKDDDSHRDTVTSRSPMENVVPLVLTGLGLALVLGVLFEARVILGEVGERRYQVDIAAVEELRREAGWRRTDGALLEANELTNRAEDLESAATRLREYAASMSRMTFPILLLNLTLVLAAISAAYFHKQTRSREQFNEAPYEQDRRSLIEGIESTADEVAAVLARVVRPIRELRTFAEDGAEQDPGPVAQSLESVISLYRTENARARGVAPENVAAFRTPVHLDLETDDAVGDLSSHLESVGEYEEERKRLNRRFEKIRERFNQQLQTWEPHESG